MCTEPVGYRLVQIRCTSLVAHHRVIEHARCLNLARLYEPSMFPMHSQSSVAAPTLRPKPANYDSSSLSPPSKHGLIEGRRSPRQTVIKRRSRGHWLFMCFSYRHQDRQNAENPCETQGRVDMFNLNILQNRHNRVKFTRADVGELDAQSTETVTW